MDGMSNGRNKRSNLRMGRATEGIRGIIERKG
jgi:hypothetical protein